MLRLPPAGRSDVGEYSAEGANACSSCPAGQYNPSKGMADQAPGQSGPDAVHCLRCPTGSIALTSGQSISSYTNELGLSSKATTCDAW